MTDATKLAEGLVEKDLRDAVKMYRSTMVTLRDTTEYDSAQGVIDAIDGVLNQPRSSHEAEVNLMDAVVDAVIAEKFENGLPQRTRDTAEALIEFRKGH